MFSSISWSQFLTTIAILLVIYYLVIICLLCKKELFSLFSFSASTHDDFHLSNENTDHPMSFNEKTATTGNEDPFLNQKVHELLEDLKNLLLTAAKAKTIKEELIMALQMLLRNYFPLNDLPIRAEINQHIIIECKVTCSITLSEAELNMLWNG